MSGDKHIPEGYFDRFGERIKSRIADLPDDVEKHAPLLWSLSSENPYRVPPQYFETLAERLGGSLYRRGRRRWLQPVVMAAVLVILITAGWWGLMLKREGTYSINEAEVYDYYIYNIDLVDQPVIYDLVDEIDETDEVYLDGLSEDELLLYEQVLIEELVQEEWIDIL